MCGPLLDWAGPRASAVSGSLITTLGVVLLGVSHPGGPDAFAGGAFCLGECVADGTASLHAKLWV